MAEGAFVYVAAPGYSGGDSFTVAWMAESTGSVLVMIELSMTVRVNVWPSAEAMARGGPGFAQLPRPSQPPGVAAAPPDQAARPPQSGQPGQPVPGGGRPPSASGSGFFINRAGQVLTNDHVIRTCREITVSQRLDRRFPATVVARDQRNDLAVLAATLPVEEWARFERDAPRSGDATVVVGYPLRGLLAFQPNVTTGNISALAGIGGDIRHVQITAPVQPGNSGGPALSLRGGVVGVVVGMVNAVALAQRAGIIPQNVNFAINNTVTRQFLTANNVAFDLVEPDAPQRAAPDIGDAAGRFTVSVECYR